MILRIQPILGEEIIIEVEPTESILEAKQKVAEVIEGYPVDQQRLNLRGVFLNDKKNMESYRLKNGTVLQLIKALRSGDERIIDVEPSDRILLIKEKLEEKEGIPPEQQRLIFQGKQLKDDKTVSNYKLKGGTILHLVVALRGGLQRT